MHNAETKAQKVQPSRSSLWEYQDVRKPSATTAGHPRKALAGVSESMKSTLQEVFLGNPFAVG
jgi:hypothetical protein